MSDTEDPRPGREDEPREPSPWERLANLASSGGDTPIGCVLLVIAGLITAIIWVVVPRWRRTRTTRRRRA